MTLRVTILLSLCLLLAPMQAADNRPPSPPRHEGDLHWLPEGGYPFTEPDAEMKQDAEALAAFARACLLHQNHAQAEEILAQLKTVFDRYPEVRAPIQLLKAVRLQHKQPKELRQDLEALCRSHPDSRLFRLELAELQSDAKDYQTALQTLEPLAAQAIRKRDSQVLQQQIKILVLSHRHKPLPALLASIEATPGLRDDLTLQMLSMVVWNLLKRPEDARRIGERVVSSPGLYRRPLLQAICDDLAKASHWELLQRYLHQYLAQNRLPDAPFRMLQHYRVLAATHLKDYADLEKAIALLLKRGRDLPQLLGDLGNDLTSAYDASRDMAHRERLLQLAITVFRLLTIHDRANPDSRRRLAILYAIAGAPDKALAIQQTIPNPTLDDQLRRASFLSQLRRFPEALKLYAEVANRPELRRSDRFHFQYGLAAAEAGETDLAIRQLRQAHALAPANDTYANALGYTLADANRELPEAHRLIALAVQKQPDNSAFLDSLAWVHFRAGNLPAALEALARLATVIPPDFPPDDPQWTEIAQHFEAILKAAGFPRLAECFQKPTPAPSRP